MSRDCSLASDLVKAVGCNPTIKSVTFLISCHSTRSENEHWCVSTSNVVNRKGMSVFNSHSLLERSILQILINLRSHVSVLQCAAQRSSRNPSFLINSYLQQRRVASVFISCDCLKQQNGKLLSYVIPWARIKLRKHSRLFRFNF